MVFCWLFWDYIGLDWAKHFFKQQNPSIWMVIFYKFTAVQKVFYPIVNLQLASALDWFRCGSWGAHQKFMLSFPSFCVPRFNLKKLVLKSENFFTFFLHMFNPQKMTVRPRSQLKPRLLKEDSAWFLLNSKIIKNWL